MPIGVEVRNRLSAASRGAPTDTDTAFVPFDGTGAGTGPTDRAVDVRSVGDFAVAYGARDTANAAAYDWLDAYFREGGRRAVVARHVPGEDGDSLTGALGLFTEKYGPGQVVAIGSEPGAATYAKLLDHCAAVGDRVALLDVDNGDTASEMEALGEAYQALDNVDYGAVFGSWVNVPAPAGVIGGGARQVPASAAVAGLIARADALGNPNRAAAGRDFPLQYATSFVTEVTDAERDALLAVGVNTFADKYGVLQLYGFQTGVEQTEDNPFWQFNCSRARMWITSHAKEAGESYMFKPIDGKGRLARALQTDMDALLLRLYQMDGLYGDTPAEAFSSEVGVQVNRTSTIAQGELRAVAEARFSLHTKRVLIDLVSVPVTGRVTAAA